MKIIQIHLWKHRRIGETTHWLSVQRRLCKAILHTQGFEIVKRINQHLHPPDEKDISCSEVKTNIKRKANESQDSLHYILGECVQTVNEGIVQSCPNWIVLNILYNINLFKQHQLNLPLWNYL